MCCSVIMQNLFVFLLVVQFFQYKPGCIVFSGSLQTLHLYSSFFHLETCCQLYFTFLSFVVFTLAVYLCPPEFAHQVSNVCKTVISLYYPSDLSLSHVKCINGYNTCAKKKHPIPHFALRLATLDLITALILHFRQSISCISIRLPVSPQVSKASSDLMRYCGEHAKYDPLLMGIPASENPFKDKKPCTVLQGQTFELL